MIEQALSDADTTLDDIDAIGVTYGPGLVGALLVGVAEAKAISYAKIYLWSECIISKDISAQTTLRIKI